jgi:isoleucyl-tRNA synthetase
LKTHSVIVDKEFEKLSKISDNQINVDDIINGVEKANHTRQYGFGADILRLWVSSTDDVVKKFE